MQFYLWQLFIFWSDLINIHKYYVHLTKFIFILPQRTLVSESAFKVSSKAWARLRTVSNLYSIRDHRRISSLILSEFKWINWLLFPLKPSEKHRFFGDLIENRNQLIRSTLSWRRPLSYRNQSIDLQICRANQWTDFYM